jgi:hypothetical protein
LQNADCKSFTTSKDPAVVKKAKEEAEEIRKTRKEKFAKPVYGGARMKTMEECVRFYHHFGLALSEAPRELPDHLVTELEFLHYLAFREAEALERGEDAGAFRRAARDFALRHPGRFVKKLEGRLARAEAMPFFRALAARLEAFLAHDAEWLVGLVGPTPPATAAAPSPGRTRA